MNNRYISLALFIFAAFILAGCINPIEEIPPTEVVVETPELYPPPFVEEGTEVTNEKFAENLASSQNVYLVEDLRNLETYPISKNNIMQCTVDYAGSPGLVGKTVTIFAFDDEGVCQSIDGPISMADCYAIIQQGAEDPNTAIIWIEKGENPEFYPGGLLVRLSDSYVQGICVVNFAEPEIASPDMAAEPPLPEVNDTEVIEAPVDAEIPEEPVDPEMPEAPVDAGDSHTFP